MSSISSAVGVRGYLERRDLQDVDPQVGRRSKQPESPCPARPSRLGIDEHGVLDRADQVVRKLLRERPDQLQLLGLRLTSLEHLLVDEKDLVDRGHEHRDEHGGNHDFQQRETLPRKLAISVGDDSLPTWTSLEGDLKGVSGFVWAGGENHLSGAGVSKGSGSAGQGSRGHARPVRQRVEQGLRLDLGRRLAGRQRFFRQRRNDGGKRVVEQRPLLRHVDRHRAARRLETAAFGVLLLGDPADQGEPLAGVLDRAGRAGDSVATPVLSAGTLSGSSPSTRSVSAGAPSARSDSARSVSAGPVWAEMLPAWAAPAGCSSAVTSMAMSPGWPADRILTVSPQPGSSRIAWPLTSSSGVAPASISFIFAWQASCTAQYCLAASMCAVPTKARWASTITLPSSTVVASITSSSENADRRLGFMAGPPPAWGPGSRRPRTC